MAGTATSPEIPVNELNAEDEVTPGEPDETLEAMKARVEQMEREAAQLRDMQAGYAHGGSPVPVIGGEHPPSEDTNMEGDDDKEAADLRSVYVGNVDYGATPEEIQAHFQSCGTINRVTILCDKFTGHPKGLLQSGQISLDLTEAEVEVVVIGEDFEPALITNPIVQGEEGEDEDFDI
ncbi:hypothetical protein Clacol_001551 [Clathrus columnatus]|uniref:RRM domain-containing protein n=1 Tax=Clathrus columnatus TaxID=1419009 RepID=A0AAV4ZZI8_9AGAM|nr:hypothetical protein Clacol_001551 [Clathrus columnatus]